MPATSRYFGALGTPLAPTETVAGGAVRPDTGNVTETVEGQARRERVELESDGPQSRRSDRCAVHRADPGSFVCGRLTQRTPV
jgi:hypothetical protein